MCIVHSAAAFEQNDSRSHSQANEPRSLRPSVRSQRALAYAVPPERSAASFSLCNGCSRPSWHGPGVQGILNAGIWAARERQNQYNGCDVTDVVSPAGPPVDAAFPSHSVMAAKVSACWPGVQEILHTTQCAGIRASLKPAGNYTITP
jgi:hypothetical protein